MHCLYDILWALVYETHSFIHHSIEWTKPPVNLTEIVVLIVLLLLCVIVLILLLIYSLCYRYKFAIDTVILYYVLLTSIHFTVSNSCWMTYTLFRPTAQQSSKHHYFATHFWEMTSLVLSAGFFFFVSFWFPPLHLELSCWLFFFEFYEELLLEEHSVIISVSLRSLFVYINVGKMTVTVDLLTIPWCQQFHTINNNLYKIYVNVNRFEQNEYIKKQTKMNLTLTMSTTRIHMSGHILKSVWYSTQPKECSSIIGRLISLVTTFWGFTGLSKYVKSLTVSNSSWCSLTGTGRKVC